MPKNSEQTSERRRTAGSLDAGGGLPASAIEEIIKQEILWHKSRRGQSGHGADWEIGFIEGLYQCLKVTQEAMRQSNDKLRDGSANNK